MRCFMKNAGLPFIYPGIKRLNDWPCRKIHTHMITKTYLKTKGHCKVKFSFTEAAESVAVVGLNNDWETSIILSKKKDGTFSCDINLPKDSQHEFKYLVNGADW